MDVFQDKGPWDEENHHQGPVEVVGFTPVVPWGTTHVASQGPLEWSLTRHLSLHLSSLLPTQQPECSS